VIRPRHGIALLFEGHSIRSRVPRFFAGVLPDLNLGTVDGRSCAGSLESRLVAVLESHPEFSHVVNGRFKGGYITRHYGNPDAGIHAVQLELSQATYMDEEPPFTYREQRAARVIPVLRSLIETLLDWAAAA
jgi:N-formylglutamate deformylase